MAVRLVLAPEAQHDINESYAWYEQRRAGLGEEFLATLDALLQEVCRSPEVHPFIYESHRRRLVRHFPYAVYYDYANDVVTVYGVFHTSRDPQKWRQRLR